MVSIVFVLSQQANVVPAFDVPIVFRIDILAESFPIIVHRRDNSHHEDVARRRIIRDEEPATGHILSLDIHGDYFSFPKISKPQAG